MSDYRCPWCGSEIEDQDYWESRPEEDYTVECGDCEREFKVRYYFEPVFVVEIPSELNRCVECDSWSIDDHCGWQGEGAMCGCPLGHDKEES